MTRITRRALEVAHGVPAHELDELRHIAAARLVEQGRRGRELARPLAVERGRPGRGGAPGGAARPRSSRSKPTAWIWPSSRRVRARPGSSRPSAASNAPSGVMAHVAPGQPVAADAPPPGTARGARPRAGCRCRPADPIPPPPASRPRAGENPPGPSRRVVLLHEDRTGQARAGAAGSHASIRRTIAHARRPRRRRAAAPPGHRARARADACAVPFGIPGRDPRPGKSAAEGRPGRRRPR